MSTQELREPRSDRRLIVTARTGTCAIPLAQVIETMRLLPVEPLGGMPRFVRGLSIIRGKPLPVVDLSALLGDEDAFASCRRLVTIRAGEHAVALAVRAVLGIRDLGSVELEKRPPLLRDVCADVVEVIGTLDEELLLVLRSTVILPESVLALLP